MRKLSHPHVVNFFGMERVDGKIYIMMEKVHGGELFDRVVQLESYSELQARATTLVLLDAIRYLHSQRICHRDLKPENLLLSHDDDPTDIKLADFGFAAEVERDAATGGPLGTLTTTCGTPGYVAPEVITATPDRPYGLTCDMWSIGVIIFVLLGGYPPFDDGADDEDGGGGDDNSALFKRILKGEYEFHDEFWCDISEAAKDFIRRLLTVKPADRITAEEALQHPWLELGEEELKNRDLQHNLVAMKAWNRKRKFKRGKVTPIPNP
jgi:serine/threonine protein kinase